ncbi:MAG TPA: response regulator, partial [Elusimicrobiales bacterium]|nr:response regulator [Elusimicrobiales bacterium]
QHGYEVLRAKDGEEAVELTKEKLPSAVIIDIKMPRKNGIEACKEIKANNATKQIPVIILTGAAGMDEMNLAMSCGAASCLTKPCDSKSLLETLANAISPGKQARWTTAKRRDSSSRN